MGRNAKLIDYKKMSISREIKEYLKPQMIYIPLESKNKTRYKHFVKEGDYVYKGQIIATSKENNFPIYSSVSGYVIKGMKKYNLNGEKVRCVVIENDFKEKQETRKGFKKNISDYTKEEFLKLLQESSISGMGGGDYPTFLKYNNEIDTLIVNGVECEPYITADYTVMKNYSEEILETIDAILEIMKIKKAYIVLKETNLKIINEFNKFIGTYPNIELRVVPDKYPNGWEREIVRQVLNIEYDKYPSENNIVVNNVSTIYAIYELLKYKQPILERIITITGDGVKKPCNIRVKIGSSIKEVMTAIDAYKNKKDLYFIAGGSMMGKSLPTDDIIVSKDLSCILVLEDKFDSETECIRCGKCANICPVYLIPVLIMENLGNKEMLDKLEPKRCIECGLCSYICPSKIELREKVVEAKEESEE